MATDGRGHLEDEIPPLQDGVRGDIEHQVRGCTIWVAPA
jgi:hypothetical protein